MTQLLHALRRSLGQLKPRGDGHGQLILARLNRRRPSAAGFGCEQGGPGLFREDYELADSGARQPPRRAPSEATLRRKGRYARYHGERSQRIAAIRGSDPK